MPIQLSAAGVDNLPLLGVDCLHLWARKTSTKTELSCCREHSTCSFFRRCSGDRSMGMALSRLYVCDPEMCFRWRPDPCIRLSIDWSVRVGCSLNGNSQRASKKPDTTGLQPRGKSSWPRIWADGSGLSKRLGRSCTSSRRRVRHEVVSQLRFSEAQPRIAGRDRYSPADGNCRSSGARRDGRDGATSGDAGIWKYSSG